MSNTHKLERARKLYKRDEPSKDLKLIGTGETCMNGDPLYVDTGGQRWGNQRKMRAKMKVDARKAERKKLNRNIELD